MLTARPKITDLNFHLFARNVHPELFNVCASRTIQRERYELRINITTDGHAISFAHDDLMLTEVSAGAHHPLPTKQLLVSHPVEGVCNDKASLGLKINYQSEVELELVNPKTFVVIQQQLDDKIEFEGLVHRFGSNGRLSFGAISYINVQAFRKHVLVRTFHTFPETCAVLKSDSRFDLTLD